MKEKTILHVDANNFFASVECAKHPELKNKPLAVSGNPKIRTGIILAKNQLAKQFGVETGEPIWQAKQKCPDLICVAPHMNLYFEYSQKLKEIYLSYTNFVEPFGIDECWLDVTASLKLFGGVDNIAEQIRQRVKNELGITVSIGISFCKLFAKLGSDLKKPDAITKIPYQTFPEIVNPLPIESIIGVGRRMKEHLNKMNVFTIGDLASVPGYILKQKFGVRAYELRRKVLGFDNDPVHDSLIPVIPKSVGNGTTTIYDIISLADIEKTIFFLAEKVSIRLRDLNLWGKRISVSIRTASLKTLHHSAVVPSPLNTASDITKSAMDLVKTFWHFQEKIRAVRISISQLSSSNEVQLSMFQNAEDRKQKINMIRDHFRKKFGKEVLFPASLMIKDFIREDF